ncbi:MAG: hypothetical protein BLM47_00635 [Candidatus Reconcilbacillus cellulovorans]|uniref:Sn-glycerol-1-phosphate dehydrogenase n=1 Tax=Candidatus Reconcilbacillus cellulovorans TaxID=1906605 RepID=A0A2A6E3P8_9BACL|nr:MAG: hypothetical protein BLM47_00635 [Candidatus Reconcilbacillus cellulovorans]
MDIETEIAAWRKDFLSCRCGHRHTDTDIRTVCRLAPGALEEAAAYVRRTALSDVLLVADAATRKAVGLRLEEELARKGVRFAVCCLTPNAAGDVTADGDAVLRVLLAADAGTRLLVAVGAGTIHDIVRLVAAKMRIPFVSVPTAPSVDGFTSAGAPVVVGGVKTTVPAVAPEALFADTEVLANAPRELIAAGYGDMIGKWTALADWLCSRELGGEPFCPTAYRMTKEALARCFRNEAAIADADEKGIAALAEALLLSGLSMQAVGHSRPASGGEHHVSHAWEMQSLARGERQRLHGVKVGVATVLVSALYRRLAEREPEPFARFYTDLPKPDDLAAKLRRVGAPSTPAELGFGPERVESALREAPGLRDRTTGLRVIRDRYPEWFAEMARATF